MTVAVDTPVGRIAAVHPRATRVFARHHIDFCCGGGKPLAEVCASRGLEVDAVLAEIEREIAESNEPERSWDRAPLAELVAHIVGQYHVPLRTELPRLAAMAEKVASVHEEKDARLAGIRDTFAGLQAELESHMMKEEEILFPMIEAGVGQQAGGPVEVMRHEHDDAGAALRRLREQTDGYSPPDDACTTWRALYSGLDDLEAAMHRHIHLENEILFPRALAGDVAGD